MNKFKIGDRVSDNHPARTEEKIGIVRVVFRDYYVIKFPQWSYNVARIEPYLRCASQPNELMKEII